MRNLKKVIALLAIFAMMMSSAAFATTFTDVAEGTDTFEAVETLNALGIIKGYEDLTFGPDKTITRAEFSAVVCRAVGLDSIIAQTNTIFSDVPASHWASGYINMASQMRVVNGMGDGTFEPESPVTYEQTVKMIMVALGYEAKAKEKGGYPTGYLVCAADANVTQNVGSINSADSAPRGLVAKLLYKAIDTPIMEQVVYGGETTYQIQDGTNWTTRKTLLSEKLNCVKVKAIVTRNEVTTLSLPVQINTNQTSAKTAGIYVTDVFDADYDNYKEDATNSVAVRIGNSKIADYIGQSVIVYAKRETGESEDLVITAVPEAGKNTKSTFPIGTFRSYVLEGNGLSRIEYLKNETDKNATRINLDTSNLSVIYNGRAAALNQIIQTPSSSSTTVPVYSKSIFNGDVTVLDRDNDGFYEMIYVNSPEILVVDEINTNSKKILSKNLNSINLNTDTNENIIYSITKDGKEIAFADLKEWDVLSVYINRLSTTDYYYKIKVITNSIEGTINETSTNEYSWGTTGVNKESFYIDGTEYCVALDAYNAQALKNNARGIFYIDEFGKIAAYNKTGGEAGNYGFVTEAKTNDNGFDSESIVVRIFEKDGTYSNRALAKNVTLAVGKDDETVKGDATGKVQKLTNYIGKEWLDIFEDTSGPGGSRIGKMIKYDVNNKGEIYNIELPLSGNDTDFFSASAAAFQSGKYAFNPTNNRLSFASSATNPGVGKTATLDENTLIFYVRNATVETPAGSGIFVNDYTKFDLDESYVGNISGLAEAEYTAQIFDVENTGIANCVLILNADAVSYSNNLAIILGTSKTQNEDAENVTKIRFLQDGVEKNALTTTDQTPTANKLNIGDGIQFSVNNKNNINKIEVLYSLNGQAEDKLNVIKGSFVDSQDKSIIVDRSLYKSDLTAFGVNDTIFSGTIQSTAKKDVKVTIGPIVKVQSGQIYVGPALLSNPADFEDLSESFVASKANVYVYDENNNSNSKVIAGDLGEVEFCDKAWLTKPALVKFGSNADELVAAPALKVRDWVVVKEYDGDVTDIVVIRPARYTYK